MSGTTITMTSDELAGLIRRLSMADGWLTITEAAARARVSRGAVNGWIERGKLLAYAPSPGKRVVKLKDLDKLIHKSLVPAGYEGPHAAAVAKAREVRSENLAMAKLG